MKQVGLIGRKIGMMQLFQDEVVVPVTVVEAGPCHVVQRKTKGKDGYEAIQLSFGKRKEKKRSRPLNGHAKVLGDVPLGKVLREFHVAEGDAYAPKDVLTVDLFAPGETVCVRGCSKGKGNAGTVKRHNFGRGDMTHGSKSHRIPGSIGAGTDPGRVFKGTRMAGRLGGGQVALRNVKIVQVDKARNLLFVKGALPGAPDSILYVLKEAKA